MITDLCQNGNVFCQSVIKWKENGQLPDSLEEDAEDWTTPKLLHAVKTVLSRDEHPFSRILRDNRPRTQQEPLLIPSSSDPAGFRGNSSGQIDMRHLGRISNNSHCGLAARARYHALH